MRQSVVTTALLVGALVISLVPAAGAAAPPAGTAGGASTNQSAIQAWNPGELDVDWAAFAEEHRDEYANSSFADAGDSSEVAREEARDAIRADYLGQSGADGSTFSSLGEARTGATAKQYYDECDDGSNLPIGGRQADRALLYRGGFDGPGAVTYNPGPTPAPAPLIDLRSMFVLQSTDDQGRFDQTAFLVYACQEWAQAALGAGGITFGLYVTPEASATEYPTILGDAEAGPDFLVSFFPENNVPGRALQIMAVRTPSRDASTWTLTYLDVAQRLDNYEIDGVVPTSAIGDFTADNGFAWTVEVVDTQQPAGGRDWFPERNFLLRAGEGDDEIVGTQVPQFPVPDSCGLQSESATQVQYVLQPQALTPNDDGYPVQWYQPQIAAPQAWDTIRDSSLGGRPRPVTIAVIDSGIDSTRFDFLAGGARIVGGLDAQYGLELEGGNNGGAIGPFLGPQSVAYQSFGATSPPRNSDRGPHGTAVASLIGATGNNTIGIAGVDWGARLMPIRVQDVNGCISNTVVAEGVKWAVDHGADIINISLAASGIDLFTPDSDREVEPLECADGLDNDNDGFIDFEPPAGAEGLADPGCRDSSDGSEGPRAGVSPAGTPEDAPACLDGRDNNDDDRDVDLDDPDCTTVDDDNEGFDGESVTFDPLRETIDYALEQGVVVVAAAGNFGADDDPVAYPAAYPGVISVGANTRAGTRAFYSSTGRWLDILAPGGTNQKTLGADVAVLWELDRIRPAAGTSFAAPLVTGAASLYLGLNPHITRGFTPAATPPDPAGNFPDVGYQRTVDDVRVALQNGVRDLAPAGHDILNGWGRLNVDRVLDVPATGGPLVDPARAQLPRTNADSVVEVAEGLALSRPTLFPDFVVLTRSDVAVDALAASSMLGAGPLLLSGTEAVSDSTLATMAQVLPDGGTVYVLGGTAALSTEVDIQLAAAGYQVHRLAGASRIDTAIAIAEEVRQLWPGSTTVGLSRSDGGADPTAQWADALSGGAWAASTATPMLVTPTGSLDPGVAAALTRWGTTDTVLFGGTSALSQAVEAAVPGPRRISGSDRASTAVAVADQLFSEPDGFLVANGYYARGWSAGLAAAGNAADSNSPLLFTGPDSVPVATADLLGRACPAPETVRIVGGASLVTGSAESQLLEAATCG